MSSDNFQGAFLGATGACPRAFDHPYSATDTPNWHSLAFFVLSCVVHAALAAFLLWHAPVKDNTEPMAGNAGGSMQVTMMSAAVSQVAAATQQSVAKNSATQPTPVVMPMLTPLPEHPAPVIKQPVIERKAIRPAIEKKPAVHERKWSEKTAKAQQETPRQAEKNSEFPVETRQKGDAPSPITSSAGVSGSAATAKAGESDRGQASRGAGKSHSQNFKALHRRVNYPARAKALGVEGSVRVKFDITGSGTVTNIRILSETPDGVFGDEVMKDMARWRYRTESPVENQVVSVVFKLSGHIQLDD
ncbi:TonB family protein [Pectobacterium cacticida]|uniref:TonB family protein n=1 Tax=Pectobacterium cacticida TaxID=69221 RepID=UPI003986137E